MSNYVFSMQSIVCSHSEMIYIALDTSAYRIAINYGYAFMFPKYNQHIKG